MNTSIVLPVVFVLTSNAIQLHSPVDGTNTPSTRGFGLAQWKERTSFPCDERVKSRPAKQIRRLPTRFVIFALLSFCLLWPTPSYLMYYIFGYTYESRCALRMSWRGIVKQTVPVRPPLPWQLALRLPQSMILATIAVLQHHGQTQAIFHGTKCSNVTSPHSMRVLGCGL